MPDSGKCQPGRSLVYLYSAVWGPVAADLVH